MFAAVLCTSLSGSSHFFDTADTARPQCAVDNNTQLPFCQAAGSAQSTAKKMAAMTCAMSAIFRLFTAFNLCTNSVFQRENALISASAEPQCQISLFFDKFAIYKNVNIREHLARDVCKHRAALCQIRVIGIAGIAPNRLFRQLRLNPPQQRRQGRLILPLLTRKSLPGACPCWVFAMVASS